MRARSKTEAITLRRNTLQQGLALNQAKFSNEPLTIFGDEIFKHVSIKDVPKRILISSFLVGMRLLSLPPPGACALFG